MYTRTFSNLKLIISLKYNRSE